MLPFGLSKAKFRKVSHCDKKGRKCAKHNWLELEEGLISKWLRKICTTHKLGYSPFGTGITGPYPCEDSLWRPRLHEEPRSRLLRRLLRDLENIDPNTNVCLFSVSHRSPRGRGLGEWSMRRRLKLY